MEVINSKIINGALEDVWDVLVNPDKTIIYMFGCKAISDWVPGSTLSWEAEIEGKKMVFVTGKVLTFQASHLLQYTVFDPNKDMEDIPANHLRVTYQLEALEGLTKLTVKQDGFELAALGEERYKEVYNNGVGWDPILQQIADLVEGKKG